MQKTAYIGIVNDDGSVDSVFCAREGELKQIGYKVLNYRTKAEIYELIGQGDLVKLGGTLNDCLSFAKFERSPIYIEKDQNLNLFFDSVRRSEIETVYLYKDNKWKYTRRQEDDSYPQLLELEGVVYFVPEN